jgi:hypothetical protein
MARQKLAVNMPGVAPGKELAGIPVGDETAEERVLALLGGTVTEDSYKVSGLLFIILGRVSFTFLKLFSSTFTKIYSVSMSSTIFRNHFAPIVN